MIPRAGDYPAISTDTRTLRPGALFVPLAGTNFDGHDFLDAAVAAGAAALLCNIGRAAPAGLPVFYVPCTTAALLQMAAAHRQQIDPIVCAITGSAGKTTTTNMLHAILAQMMPAKKTIGNFNNAIGMPHSIFALQPDDKAIVLEMGMNRAGEISPLSRAAAPDVAIITNIGFAHIENFADQHGILCAKLEILDGLGADGMVVWPADDAMLASEAALQRVAAHRLHTVSPDAVLRTAAAGIGTYVQAAWQGCAFEFELQLPGAHMVQNAMLAAAAAILLGAGPAHIAQGLATVRLPAGRMDVRKTPGGCTIIDDTYNASPDAVHQALQVLRDQPTAAHGRRVAILGDMFELGRHAAHLHSAAGTRAAACADMLVTIGTLAHHMHLAWAAAAPQQACHHFECINDFLAADLIRAQDVVLVKAARGMGFERVVDGLLRRFGGC